MVYGGASADLVRPGASQTHHSMPIFPLSLPLSLPASVPPHAEYLPDAEYSPESRDTRVSMSDEVIASSIRPAILRWGGACARSRTRKARGWCQLIAYVLSCVRATVTSRGGNMAAQAESAAHRCAVHLCCLQWGSRWGCRFAAPHNLPVHGWMMLSVYCCMLHAPALLTQLHTQPARMGARISPHIPGYVAF